MTLEVRMRRKKTENHPFGDFHPQDDYGIGVHRPAEAESHHFWSEARLLVRDCFFAIVFAVLIMVFLVQPVKVEGSSMLPRLHDGERIFVNKLVYYDLPELERSDIIVFWFPDDPTKSYIKRIIGLPGETVEIRNGRVFVNGVMLDEKYLDPQRNRISLNKPPTLVKPHYYFVMGDNRDRSSDSREWGLVPEKYIYGKAMLRFYPFSVFGMISHEPDATVAPPDASKLEDMEDGADVEEPRTSSDEN